MQDKAQPTPMTQEKTSLYAANFSATSISYRSQDTMQGHRLPNCCTQ